MLPKSTYFMLPKETGVLLQDSIMTTITGGRGCLLSEVTYCMLPKELLKLACCSKTRMAAITRRQSHILGRRILQKLGPRFEL